MSGSLLPPPTVTWRTLSLRYRCRHHIVAHRCDWSHIGPGSLWHHSRYAVCISLDIPDRYGHLCSLLCWIWHVCSGCRSCFQSLSNESYVNVKWQICYIFPPLSAQAGGALDGVRFIQHCSGFSWMFTAKRKNHHWMPLIFLNQQNRTTQQNDTISCWRWR